MLLVLKLPVLLLFSACFDASFPWPPVSSSTDQGQEHLFLETLVLDVLSLYFDLLTNHLCIVVLPLVFHAPKCCQGQETFVFPDRSKAPFLASAFRWSS
jgi:hypothetical protein